MSYTFRFYCFSSGFDIFIKYGYYDIRAEEVKFFVFACVELAYVRRFGIGGRSLFCHSFSSIKFLPLKTEKTITLNRVCHLKLQ
jgi:hypothetical protein